MLCLDGEQVRSGTAKVGTFLQIKAAFQPGDIITASFGMEPSFKKINDNRTGATHTIHSVHSQFFTQC